MSRRSASCSSSRARKSARCGAVQYRHAGAIIESTHLPNGTLNIITVGVERFRIRRLIHDQPYLRGKGDAALEEQEDADAVDALADSVRKRVALYIKLIAEAAGLEIKVDQMPDLPQQVGYLAAITMQIDNREKQELLVSRSLGAS